MADFDNVFDSAISDADNVILRVMATEVKISSGPDVHPVRAVFDDPESISFASGGGVRIDGTSPSLFVKSADVSWLQRLDVVEIAGIRYWVDRIGPDDSGSRYIYLGTGEPPIINRRR
ncbi:head-tail joining protein [Brenneria populi subsp. brevivirga]|uniref:head-tail joining protein n=1 Tax=Brenneria populi TaxID=1505588 RepID=UPI002E18A333|nr:head-tail joining protein [Brenneria populi subsp. brevivirga]